MLYKWTFHSSLTWVILSDYKVVPTNFGLLTCNDIVLSRITNKLFCTWYNLDVFKNLIFLSNLQTLLWLEYFYHKYLVIIWNEESINLWSLSKLCNSNAQLTVTKCRTKHGIAMNITKKLWNLQNFSRVVWILKASTKIQVCHNNVE